MNFSPSNPYINLANQYTGQFKVSYKVQTRLIWKSNKDEHGQTLKARILAKIQDNILKYYTWQMK